jgi:hypothetical protein
MGLKTKRSGFMEASFENDERRLRFCIATAQTHATEGQQAA